MRRALEYIGIFETNLSAAEWVWRLVTLGVIAAGGTTAGVLAETSEVFKQLGPLAWIAVGLVVAMAMAAIFYLVRTATLRAAQAAHLQAMAARPGSINPLLHSFTDLVIPIEDLRLPGAQVHSRKQFKRCHFVGPGVLALQGGDVADSDLHNIGDIVLLPHGTLLTGVLVLDQCLIEQCHFHRTTLLVSPNQIDELRRIGATIAGERQVRPAPAARRDAAAGIIPASRDGASQGPHP
jgi:hypothetical protein